MLVQRDILGSMVQSRTRQLSFEGHRLVFDEYGSGDRVVLLLPPLLLGKAVLLAPESSCWLAGSPN